MTTQPSSDKGTEAHLANTRCCNIKGDSLASEGILDGYTLVFDMDVKPHVGDLAMLQEPGGRLLAKRVMRRDLGSAIGRVIQSYVIPKDCKYLVLRDVKNY